MKAVFFCVNLMAVAYSRAISFDLSGDSFAAATYCCCSMQLQLQLLPHHTGNPSVACHLLPFEVLAVAPQGANRSWWSQLIAFPRRKIRSP